MRTSHKAELRLRIGILPYNGVVCLYALKLLVSDDVFLRALGNEGISKLLCLGSEVVDVVESDSTVRCGCRT